MPSKLYEAGLKIRKAVLGEDYVEKSLKTVDAFDREFEEMVTEYCWGVSWGSSGLSRKQRSLNNLCILAALNRPNHFRIHVRGALRNGCTLDEVRETLIQITIYCGVPVGSEAFRLAREVLTEEGIDLQKAPRRPAA
ncbi:MAG: 4-carboxymuconolactone decarboxylase [Rhodospirillales bacterium]|nr:4-carboxymuconolactone decarboxylase [Rhodospirillales bacterium]